MPTTISRSEDTITLVEEFHEAFNCYTQVYPGVPRLMAMDKMELLELSIECSLVAQRAFKRATQRLPGTGPQAMFTRVQLIAEELGELIEAIANDDDVQTLDALCDLQYVLDGTWLALGMGDLKRAAVEEVHRSNMLKLVGGKPMVNEAGRVMKPSNWEPPNLAAVMGK